MISRSALPRLVGALVVAAAPLAATAIAQVLDTPGVSVRADLGPAPRIQTGDPERAPPSGNPMWAIPLDTLSDTRDRPIFAPSRRPPPSPVVEAPFVPPPPPRVETKPPPEPLMLSLVGTIVGDSQGVALFTEKGSQEVVRLRTGEAHQGWVLRSVQGRNAMLEKGDRQETVTLPVPGDTSPIARGTVMPVPPPGGIVAAAPPGGEPTVPTMTDIRDNNRRQNRR
jgi:general secretion pathway protein N